MDRAGITIGLIMLGLSLLFLIGGELPILMTPSRFSFLIRRQDHPVVFWIGWGIWTASGAFALFLGLGLFVD